MRRNKKRHLGASSMFRLYNRGGVLVLGLSQLLGQRFGVRRPWHIHEDITHAIEVLGSQWLGEEVGQVVNSFHEGDGDHVVLNALADKEVPSIDVLGARMELRVVADGDRRLVVALELGGIIAASAEFTSKAS